jgi:hypothetical protein
MTNTETDPYTAALAHRPYLDDTDADALRAVAQQWREARAEAGDLPVGTHVVDYDVDPAEVESDEVGLIVEPTETELAEGAADSCAFESGEYVLVEWPHSSGTHPREWTTIDDVQALTIL